MRRDNRIVELGAWSFDLNRYEMLNFEEEKGAEHEHSNQAR
jgi:hypothetical protein